MVKKSIVLLVLLVVGTFLTIILGQFTGNKDDRALVEVKRFELVKGSPLLLDNSWELVRYVEDEALQNEVVIYQRKIAAKKGAEISYDKGILHVENPISNEMVYEVCPFAGYSGIRQDQDTETLTMSAVEWVIHVPQGMQIQ